MKRDAFLTTRLAERSTDLVAANDLLERCLKVASGEWRDRTGLNISAHPVWDDVRSYLETMGR